MDHAIDKIDKIKYFIVKVQFDGYKIEYWKRN